MDPGSQPHNSPATDGVSKLVEELLTSQSIAETKKNIVYILNNVPRLKTDFGRRAFSSTAPESRNLELYTYCY